MSKELRHQNARKCNTFLLGQLAGQGTRTQSSKAFKIYKNMMFFFKGGSQGQGIMMKAWPQISPPLPQPFTANASSEALAAPWPGDVTWAACQRESPHEVLNTCTVELGASSLQDGLTTATLNLQTSAITVTMLVSVPEKTLELAPCIALALQFHFQKLAPGIQALPT